MWGHPAILGFDEEPSPITSASENWKLSMDLVDVELARSAYQGRYLSFRPFFGARGAWIRENLHVIYTEEAGNWFDINGKFNSWAVGPRTGLYTNWMIGQGFRLYGNGAGDILYTRYTSLKENDNEYSSDGTLIENFTSRQKNLGCVRTHLELELGLGWGSYFDNNNWHVDLSAGYTFQVFFDQNMFRKFDEYGSSLVYGFSTLEGGNLYLQGMTASMRLDF